MSFRALRGVVGVVHVLALPGDPRNRGASFSEVERHSLEDVAALARGGVNAIIIENFGSAPFSKSRVPPHQAAALAIVARRARDVTDLPIGMNCLRNDAASALGIAAAAGGSFVRINVHVGAYVTDQGLVEGRADRSLRYRQSLGLIDKIAILADVLVKHAAPLAPISMAEAVRDTVERGLADGVIVSGSATGAPVNVAELEEARRAAGVAPVFIGSGFTPDLAATHGPLVDGIIVGTWVKRDGLISAPVDSDRVRRLIDAALPKLRS